MDTHETTVYSAILIASVVIGIIILFFALSIIRQQKRVLRLQRENMIAEISAMEKERARVASDLHDDISPMLSVVKFQIDNIESADAEEKEELTKASTHINDLATKLREISNNLMPSALVRKGLFMAIEEFKNRVMHTRDLKINFSYRDQLQFSDDQSIQVYRIIQELVHNSLKHSKATELLIDLRENKKNLTILYKDNGIGFDYEKLISESSGIGLKSMKNRVELIGGSMRVDSKESQGTAFLFTIPMT